MSDSFLGDIGNRLLDIGTRAGNRAVDSIFDSPAPATPQGQINARTQIQRDAATRGAGPNDLDGYTQDGQLGPIATRNPLSGVNALTGGNFQTIALVVVVVLVGILVIKKL